MTIAAYATGCEHGYLYIRAEYPLAHARLENAIAQARAAGLLGDGFDIELRIGRRRLRLRRGDGALPVDRGLPGRAPQQAALPGRGRPLRQADRRQQRRDARERAGDPQRRRPGDAALLRLGRCRAPGSLRARARHAPARAARARRGRAGEGGAARRRRGGVPRPGRARRSGSTSRRRSAPAS